MVALPPTPSPPRSVPTIVWVLLNQSDLQNKDGPEFAEGKLGLFIVYKMKEKIPKLR